MPIPNCDIEGVWNGHYHYRKIFGLTLMRPVQFFAVFKSDDDGIHGRIYEPNTFGSRSTDHLEADMLNLEIADRNIRFRKKYDGTGGVKHGISYQGDISSDGLKIAGTWNIGWLTSGTFELAKENPEQTEKFHSGGPPPLERPKQLRWPFYAGVALIATVMLVSAWFTRLSPDARDAREFLNVMPEQRIVEIRLEPNGQRSPARSIVRITDRKRIAELAAAFRAARSISPNHPSTQWAVTVRFITAEREYGGHVAHTSNQGVLFWYSSDVTSGWNYGTWRNDALGPLIQQMLKGDGQQ